MRNLGSFRVAAVLSSGLFIAASGGCADPEPSDGLRACAGDLCVDIFRAIYTIEPCDGAPAETCTYANVYFTLAQGDSHVKDLQTDDLQMRINNREVGVEGGSRLTQENGLLVNLLLDRSYSITESQATQAVRDAAKAFILSLPDDAFVSVSVFASEAVVPLVLNEWGEDPYTGTYYSLHDSRAVLLSLVDGQYNPYASPTSYSFTKLYDAVARSAEFEPASDALAAMQQVNIVFTDGADTASTNYASAEAVRSHLAKNYPDEKVYAIGLGNQVDVDVLSTLADDRFYLAGDQTQLETAFAEVADDLSAIYQYRILVSQQEFPARASLSIVYDGTSLSTSFDMGSLYDGY